MESITTTISRSSETIDTSPSTFPAVSLIAATPSPQIERSFAEVQSGMAPGGPSESEKSLMGLVQAESLDTLAVRRAKAAGRGGKAARNGGEDDPGASPPTIDAGIDYTATPPIAPIRPPPPFLPHGASYCLSPDPSTSGSSLATSTDPPSSISTSFASIGTSSFAPSPISPPPGEAYSVEPHRRGSVPVAGPSSWASWSQQSEQSDLRATGASQVQKAFSENGWTNRPMWPPQSEPQGSVAAVPPQPVQEPPAESPSKPFLVSKGPPPLPRSQSFSKKGPGRVALPGADSPYKPSLPSPLSNVLHPDSMREHSSQPQWTPMSPSALSPMRSPLRNSPSVNRSPRGEFPFPPSPVTASFSPEITGHSPQITAATPLLTPPMPTSTTKSQTSSESRPQRPERVRSKSGDAVSSPSKAAFHPTASHWRATSVSQQPTPLLSAGPLTPPESSGRPRLTSAADLAWGDVSMGRMGLGALIDYGSRIGHKAASGEAHSKSLGVADLMSLEGDEPSHPGAGAAPLGSADSRRTTPTENLKRVGHGDLMGGTGGGHFGPATREKLANVIHDLLDGVPLPEDDGLIGIVEYGALNSRSSSLVAPIIASLATRHATMREERDLPVTDDDTLSFQVTHTDKLSSDFRSLSQQLESHGDSYLNSQWLDSQRPSLENKVFSSFAARPFAAKVVPKASVSVGFSAMALHWLSMDRKYRMAPVTLAHGELMAFLSARATEFKPGGVLALAFISRSEDDPRKLHPGPGNLQSRASADPGVGSLPTLARPLERERSNSSPAVPLARKDIWAVLSSILGKAIQRLVSTQLLKPAVARQLLALPIHPRSPRQTKAVLRAMQHAWTIEKDEVILLSHPAWRGLEHNTVSAASYTDHTIQLLKIFWESEMRSILREALMSRAACEWIIECLFDIAREKVEESGPQPLELEVQIVALRRRKVDASNVGSPAPASSPALSTL